jgi:hypothetical protein
VEKTIQLPDPHEWRNIRASDEPMLRRALLPKKSETLSQSTSSQWGEVFLRAAADALPRIPSTPEAGDGRNDATLRDLREDD